MLAVPVDMTIADRALAASTVRSGEETFCSPLWPQLDGDD